MQTAYLPYRTSQIHYLQFGRGKRILVCLHGYGESGNSFRHLAPLLQEQYRVYAPDMPFHGLTEWKEGPVFTPQMLWEIICKLNPSGEPFTLMGYSMGGRLALSLLEQHASAIRQLVLLAPDGLHTNPWYWLSTQTRMGNRLFKYSMQHPAWLFKAMKLGLFTRLLHPSVGKIARFYLDDEQQRQLLYQRWTALRLFRPRLSLLKKVIVANQLPVQLVFGRFDQIIRSTKGYAFARGIEEVVQVQLIEAGHQLLKEKYLPFIAGLLVA